MIIKNIEFYKVLCNYNKSQNYNPNFILNTRYNNKKHINIRIYGPYTYLKKEINYNDIIITKNLITRLILIRRYDLIKEIISK